MAINIEGTSIRVVSEILDNGLLKSDWKVAYPEAYLDLLDYRRDLEASVTLILNKVIEEEKG